MYLYIYLQDIFYVSSIHILFVRDLFPAKWAM